MEEGRERERAKKQRTGKPRTKDECPKGPYTVSKSILCPFTTFHFFVKLMCFPSLFFLSFFLSLLCIIQWIRCTMNKIIQTTYHSKWGQLAEKDPSSVCVCMRRKSEKKIQITVLFSSAVRPKWEFRFRRIYMICSFLCRYFNSIQIFIWK